MALKDIQYNKRIASGDSISLFSAATYKELYEKAADAIVLLDDQGNILDANEMFLELFPYPVNELVGVRLFDFFHPDDLKSAPLQFSRVLAGERVRIDRRIRRLDGSYIPIEIHAKRIRENLIQALFRDTTLRRLLDAERTEALVQAEILEKIFSTTHFCCVVMDKDFNLLRVNKAYADSCGFPPEYFPGKNHFEMYPHDENEAIFRRVLETGEPYTVFSKPFVFPDDPDRGVTYWDWTLKPLRDSAGNIEGLIFILLDVSERAKMLEAVRESEKKFRLVTENIQDVFWMSTPGVGKMIYVSPAYEKIWGRSTESLYADPTSMLDLVVQEDIEHLKHFFFDFHAKGKEYAVEYRIRGIDDSVKWIQERGFPIRDEDGHVSLMCGVCSDITERKTAEQKIAESENLFRQMFEGNLAIKLLIDPETSRILNANEAAALFYGYDLQTLKSMKISDLNVLSAEEISDHMDQAASSTRKQFDFRHKLASGMIRDVEVYSSPITVKGKKLLYSIVFDVTERNSALADLLRSNKDLEYFAYVASHDLQEPLRNVAGALQMLEKSHKGKLDEKSDQLIEYAVNSAKKMKALIQDLLTYSRITAQTHEVKFVDSELALHRCLSNLKSLIEETGTTVTFGKMPRIRGDFTQLVQVFQNLITNAIKFGPAESPQVHVSATREGNEVVFCVQDNGRGIEKKFFDRIFVIFQQLERKQSFQGTGIGLAIVKKIVENNKGRVWVESMIGYGSKFYFSFPDGLES